jgi:hypothetical protein
MIVAMSARIRAQLGWTPRFDDLDTIVAHALAWERRLGPLREGLRTGRRTYLKFQGFLPQSILSA